MMLIRSKVILAATGLALALPAAAMADGPSNSASPSASNYSSTSQNAVQVGGGYGSGRFLVQNAYTNQEADSYANATQIVVGSHHKGWH
jgi:hypothetical protein